MKIEIAGTRGHYIVKFSQGNQTFTLFPYLRIKKEAVWFKSMLDKAFQSFSDSETLELKAKLRQMYDGECYLKMENAAMSIEVESERKYADELVAKNAELQAEVERLKGERKEQLRKAYKEGLLVMAVKYPVPGFYNAEFEDWYAQTYEKEEQQ